MPVIARVAAALGLPGNAPEAVDAARSKRLTLVETRVRTACRRPASRRSSTARTLPNAADIVGFPAVIKPEFGTVVDRLLPRGLAGQSRARPTPASCPMLPSLEPIFTEYGTNLILEEYLDGTEFDIDLVFSEGAAAIRPSRRTGPRTSRTSSRRACTRPAGSRRTGSTAIIDLSIRGHEGAGPGELGVFHVEAKNTSQGPAHRRGERADGRHDRARHEPVGPRGRPGGGAPDGHRRHPRCARPRPPRRCAAVANLLLIYAAETGTLASTDFVDEIAADPRVFFAAPSLAEGRPGGGGRRRHSRPSCWRSRCATSTCPPPSTAIRSLADGLDHPVPVGARVGVLGRRDAGDVAHQDALRADVHLDHHVAQRGDQRLLAVVRPAPPTGRSRGWGSPRTTVAERRGPTRSRTMQPSSWYGQYSPSGSVGQPGLGDRPAACPAAPRRPCGHRTPSKVTRVAASRAGATRAMVERAAVLE